MKWTPGPSTPSTSPSDTPAGPDIFAAIRDQLGLKLDSVKGPFDVLVIDSAQKPTVN
jgi:uncharacterized protein (TIGR03435 family)